MPRGGYYKSYEEEAAQVALQLPPRRPFSRIGNLLTQQQIRQTKQNLKCKTKEKKNHHFNQDNHAEQDSQCKPKELDEQIKPEELVEQGKPEEVKEQDPQCDQGAPHHQGDQDDAAPAEDNPEILEKGNDPNDQDDHDQQDPQGKPGGLDEHDQEDPQDEQGAQHHQGDQDDAAPAEDNFEILEEGNDPNDQDDHDQQDPQGDHHAQGDQDDQADNSEILEEGNDPNDQDDQDQQDPQCNQGAQLLQHQGDQDDAEPAADDPESAEREDDPESAEEGDDQNTKENQEEDKHPSVSILHCLLEDSDLYAGKFDQELQELQLLEQSDVDSQDKPDEEARQNEKATPNESETEDDISDASKNKGATQSESETEDDNLDDEHGGSGDGFPWITVDGVDGKVEVLLTTVDRELILHHGMLHDRCIKFGRMLLEKQYQLPMSQDVTLGALSLPGLQFQKAPPGTFQILHCGGNDHWCLTSNKGGKIILIDHYTKVFVPPKCLVSIVNLYANAPQSEVQVVRVNVYKQPNDWSCGYTCLGWEAAIAASDASIDQIANTYPDFDSLGSWLVECFENGEFTPMPTKLAAPQNAEKIFKEVALDYITLRVNKQDAVLAEEIECHPQSLFLLPLFRGTGILPWLQAVDNTCMTGCRNVEAVMKPIWSALGKRQGYRDNLQSSIQDTLPLAGEYMNLYCSTIEKDLDRRRLCILGVQEGKFKTCECPKSTSWTSHVIRDGTDYYMLAFAADVGSDLLLETPVSYLISSALVQELQPSIQILLEGWSTAVSGHERSDSNWINKITNFASSYKRKSEGHEVLLRQVNAFQTPLLCFFSIVLLFV